MKTEEQLREEIRILCEEENVPELEADVLESLKAKVREKRAVKRVHVSFWKNLAVAACCLLIMIPCIVLPIVLREDESYYSEDDVVQEEISKEYLTQYFSENYSQYSFFLDECDVLFSYGYYDNTNKQLLAVSLVLDKQDIPFTKIEFDLILTNKYKFKGHDSYVKDAVISKQQNYTLYQKLTESFYDEEFHGLLEYPKYKLYIHMNLNDSEFFEKFL